MYSTKKISVRAKCNAYTRVVINFLLPYFMALFCALLLLRRFRAAAIVFFARDSTRLRWERILLSCSFLDRHFFDFGFRECVHPFFGMGFIFQSQKKTHRLTSSLRFRMNLVKNPSCKAYICKRIFRKDEVV